VYSFVFKFRKKQQNAITFFASAQSFDNHKKSMNPIKMGPYSRIILPKICIMILKELITLLRVQQIKEPNNLFPGYAIEGSMYMTDVNCYG